MFAPRKVENLFGDDYDEVRLDISFHIQAGQVVMQFSDHVENSHDQGWRSKAGGDAYSKGR
jgi:hypothetical protein